MKLFGDTLAVLSENLVKFYNAKSGKLFYELPLEFDQIESIDSIFYFFGLYGNIMNLNIKNNKIANINSVQSFLPYPQSYNQKIIFLNREKGFSIIEKDTAFNLTSTDKSIPFVSDYALANDTLFALIKNSIKSYKIDLLSQKLILLNNRNLDEIIDGFSIKWIITKNHKLYLGNDKGILQFNVNRNEVEGYYYFGNYTEIQKPFVVGDSLLITTKSALTKIAFSEFDNNKILTPESLIIHSPETVNENLSFKVEIQNASYLIQNHSLKRLQLIRNGEFVSKKYS